MAGANQHLTYTYKDLVNVIDISYLRIKVSHPNRTEAFITKVARDSKFIVGFDESNCFVKYQDLMDVKIMEIGKQVGGLYYFDKIKGGIPFNLWYVRILTACYLINRFPSSVLKGKSPYHLVFNEKPSLKHLRVFGCLCFAIVLNNHDKFSSRAKKCVLIKSSSDVNKSSQGLNHVNFFDEVIYEGLDIPYDDTNLNAQPQNEGSNSFHLRNPTIDLVEDELGHPQSYNGFADENEMAATSENDFVISEGDIADIPKTQNTFKI
ncbi:ribonuclease H-like domain-containing protein [Tanacetum coccineum]